MTVHLGRGWGRGGEYRELGVGRTGQWRQGNNIENSVYRQDI